MFKRLIGRFMCAVGFHPVTEAKVWWPHEARCPRCKCTVLMDTNGLWFAVGDVPEQVEWDRSFNVRDFDPGDVDDSGLPSATQVMDRYGI